MSSPGNALAGGPSFINSPIVDPQTGRANYQFIRWFQDASQRLENGLNQLGQLIGTINPSTKIQGRTEGIGTTVQHINNTGVVNSPGMTAATPAAQGAVVLPAGALSNTLGAAALEPLTAFDAAGSAAAAQTAAEVYAAAQAASAQAAAEAYASNASNISSGTVASAHIPALSSLTGPITLTQLPANMGAVSSGSGAPASTPQDGSLYFDTSASPAHGYARIGGAWVQFS